MKKLLIVVFDLQINVQILLYGVLSGLIYGLMSSGYALVYGTMKIINLAHGFFFTAGCFLTYLFFTRLGFHIGVSIVLAIVLTFLLGMAFERGVVRYCKGTTRDIEILTLAFAMFGENLILATFGPYNLFIPYYIKGVVRIAGLYISYQRILIILVSVPVFALLWFLIFKTNFGRGMRAASQDKEIIGLMGINIQNVNLITFGLSALVAGVAGIVLLPLGPIYPSMGWSVLIRAFTIVIFGGMGSIKGTLVGGLLLGLAETLFGYYFFEGIRDIFLFAVIIIMLLVRPSGLFGEILR